MNLTEMEVGIFSAFYVKYATQGFPAPHQIQFQTREETGAGRFTRVSSENSIDLPDGYLYLPDCYVELAEVDYGASPVVIIENKKLVMLEIVVNGEQDWSGSESGWALVC